MPPALWVPLFCRALSFSSFSGIGWMVHRHLGGDLIVVLDGGAERLARADQFRQQFPLHQPQQLLIRCPVVPLHRSRCGSCCRATTRLPRSLLWLIGSVAARLSLPSASGSLPIRSTLPVPPCWPASPWLAVASRSNRIRRHVPAPANAASWFAMPCE